VAEAPLSPAEAQEILAAGPDGVLIGGMALAFWATYFRVEPPTALAAGVTRDLDFFGPAAVAHRFAERLHEVVKAVAVEVFTPTPGDVTPNTAKIVLRGFHGRADPVEIDYLGSVHGFDYAAECRMRKRAVPVEVGAVRLQVMDPIDVLASRVHNDTLASKRDRPATAEQIRLAVTVTRAFIASVGATAVGTRSPALRIAGEVGALAGCRAGIGVFIRHGVDLLHAVPEEAISSPTFRDRRWPQIAAHVDARRARAWRQRERAADSAAPATSPARRPP
jgi:hypothetical protein